MQIRLHLAHVGHPIFGDRLYGVQVSDTNLAGNNFCIMSS